MYLKDIFTLSSTREEQSTQVGDIIKFPTRNIQLLGNLLSQSQFSKGLSIIRSILEMIIGVRSLGVY